MRYLMILICPLISYAGFNDLGGDSLYEYESKKSSTHKKTPTKLRKSKTKRKNSALNDLTKKLLKEEKNLVELLKRQEKSVILRIKDSKILSLTRVEGVVLNSILAMNVRPSKFIVRLSGENDLLEDGELRCFGYSFQRRVPAKCNLLVLNNEEYEVDVELWDLDGAEGIISDYFYSGEEKAFLTSSFASFLQGVLDTAQDRVLSPFGELAKNNSKNKVLGGLSGVASNVKDLVSESGEKNLSVSFIDSGKRVLAFFNRSLTLKGRSR